MAGTDPIRATESALDAALAADAELRVDADIVAATRARIQAMGSYSDGIRDGKASPDEVAMWFLVSELAETGSAADPTARDRLYLAAQNALHRLIATGFFDEDEAQEVWARVHRRHAASAPKTIARRPRFDAWQPRETEGTTEK